MPDPELRAVEPPPTQQTDPLLYRIVVIALAAGMLLVIAGGLVLSGIQIPIDTALIGLGSFCAGGLAGLLAPSPAK